MITHLLICQAHCFNVANVFIGWFPLLCNHVHGTLRLSTTLHTHWYNIDCVLVEDHVMICDPTWQSRLFPVVVILHVSGPAKSYSNWSSYSIDVSTVLHVIWSKHWITNYKCSKKHLMFKEQLYTIDVQRTIVNTRCSKNNTYKHLMFQITIVNIKLFKEQL